MDEKTWVVTFFIEIFWILISLCLLLFSVRRNMSWYLECEILPDV